MENLITYYKKKQKVYHEALIKTETEFWANQSKLDKERSNKEWNFNNNDRIRRTDNVEKIFS